MSLIWMRHASYMNESSLWHKWSMSLLSYEWHKMNHSYVWHESWVMSHIWMIHMCGMDHSYVWHDLSTHVTLLIWTIHVTHMLCPPGTSHVSDMTDPYLLYECASVTWVSEAHHSRRRHDSWETSDMRHDSWETSRTLSSERVMSETWLIQEMRDVSHESCLWLSRVMSLTSLTSHVSDMMRDMTHFLYEWEHVYVCVCGACVCVCVCLCVFVCECE